MFLCALITCGGCGSSQKPAVGSSQDPQTTDSGRSGNENGDSETAAGSLQTGEPESEETSVPSSTGSKEKGADSANAASAPATAESRSMSAEAFLRAAGEGKTDEVKTALDNGMNIESAETGRDHTALHHAAYNGHTQTVLLLIERGATVDARDFEGKTPLIHACTGPFPETVQALVKAGADVNAKGTAEGFTPLMMAAGLDQLKTVEILLDNGANKDAVDDDNDKAIDHARRKGLTEIVKLLD